MELQRTFHAVAQELGMESVTATYYPYSELKHTWRYDGLRWEFKISDYLESADPVVLESLAWHLLSRARAVRCPRNRSEPYLTFVRSSRLWNHNRHRYLERSRTLTVDPAGKARDLHVVFSYVNSTYFSGGLREPVLAWTRESPRTRLGFYFEQLDLLAINRVLDTEEIPRYVLEFVMYHELLHHADRRGLSKRTVKHTKGFREREKLFSAYEDAEAWLRRIVARSGRTRR